MKKCLAFDTINKEVTTFPHNIFRRSNDEFN